jgi:hypothetical protein
MDRSFWSSGLTLTHVVLLMALLAWSVWSLRRDRAIAICALFVVGWTDLVCTALLLSFVGRLGDRFAYVGLSLLLALVFRFALHRSLKALSPQDISLPIGSVDEDGSRLNRLMRGFCWLAILAVLIPTVMLCISYAPNNFDSVAYRLPRAFLYLGQGMLKQMGGGDFRMQYYPFDMTLVYLATAIHGLGSQWFNLFGFVAWLMGGIAVGRSAREFGAGRTAALFAATIYLTAPAVLVSAASTNDDMIAGVPLLIGLLFATRWWRSGNTGEAALAAMGLGLSAGSKLHYIFLVPVAGVFCIALLYQLFGSGLLKAFLRRRALQFVGMIILLIALGLPSQIINVVQTGRATVDLPNFINKPFSVVSASVSSILSSANLFLAPIPDLDLDYDAVRRKVVYDQFNAWPKKHLFSWVSPALDYSNEPYYRFESVTEPNADQGVWEQSVWLGFIPWLLLLIPACAWSKRIRRDTPAANRLRVAGLWLTATFFSWHLTRCSLIKYVGSAGIYYAYPMVLAGPALAWLWDAPGPDRRRLRFALRTACLLVLATNMISALNAFAYNQQRNLPQLLRADHFRPRQGVVDPRLSAALSASRHTLIAYTEWEEPLLDLMSVQPKARYTLEGSIPAASVPGYDLSLMLERVTSTWGDIPLQFVNDDRPRLAELGTLHSVYGDQRAFGRESGPGSALLSTGDVIAAYESNTDQGGLQFVSGWSPTEHTHRWSDGADSAIDFDLPIGEAGCRLDMTAITLGPQHISVTLNDQPAGTLSLESWFPGQGASLALPDAAIFPGDRNHLVLQFDNAHAPEGDNRRLALGLVKAAVMCHQTIFTTVASPHKTEIFVYAAAGEENADVFTKGWSPSERTHRWSNASESELDFQLPAGRKKCVLDTTAITAGAQQITPLLNGQTLDVVRLQSWFPGQEFHVELPDEALHQGANNAIMFRYDHTEAVEGRKLALGIIRAAVRCRVDSLAAGRLPFLNKQGFAVLGIDERRDPRGGLTGVELSRINGTDPDESFEVSLSLVSTSGEVTPVLELQPLRWSQWVTVPNAPTDGHLKLLLRRIDRPEIMAQAFVPIAATVPLALDLRSIERREQ